MCVCVCVCVCVCGCNPHHTQNIPGTSGIVRRRDRTGFVAESTSVGKSVAAMSPTYGPNTVIPTFACGITQSRVFFRMIGRASENGLAHTATIGSLPAHGGVVRKQSHQGRQMPHLQGCQPPPWSHRQNVSKLPHCTHSCTHTHIHTYIHTCTYTCTYTYFILYTCFIPHQ